MKQQLPKIHIIATGGTISGIGFNRLDYTQYSDTGNRYTIEQLLERIPEVKSFADISFENLLATGSTNITPKDWLVIGERANTLLKDDIDGIVITHGTATLEETAYFLHLTINSNKPVVLTGAMRPPSSISTDADINLFDAIRIASSKNAKNMGVMGVLNNQIHSAREMIKMNTLRVDTFQSNDLGFLGFVDSDGQVIFYRNSTKIHTFESEFSTQSLDQLPRVDIVVAYSGGDGLLIDAVKKNASQGLILAGFGSGTLPTIMKDSALELVKDGIPVVLASRSTMGRIVLTKKIKDEGFITCDNLSPQKARILLMLSLLQTSDTQKIRDFFEKY
jgi:L-asparaginase